MQADCHDKPFSITRCKGMETREVAATMSSPPTPILGLGVRDSNLAWLAEQLGMHAEALHPHAHVNMAREVETAIH